MSFFRNHSVRRARAAFRAIAFFGIAMLAWPQTSPLTTIQDTLFSADGTRFNGTLTISWNTFDAAGLGTVVQQSKTVTVVRGNLYVQLAPTVAANAPANVYTVLYQSDGYQQSTETWIVPASTAPLPVAAVRVSVTTGNLTSAGSAGSATTITEAAVTGLVSDLQQRPVKGASYANGAVAVIDANGQIEAAAGSPGSCVMVDGTTGPCGSGGPVFVDAEIPGGAVNGTNAVFTLQNAPSGGSLTLFRNGMYMLAGFDYTLTGSTIQFRPGAAPQTGDTLAASYRLPATTAAPVSGSLSASAQPLAAPQIICGGAGSSTSSAATTQLASCSIPASSLQPGSRIEVRFTVAHTGSNSGFAFEADWNGAAVISRTAGAADAAVTGAGDASIGTAATQIGAQSWGSALPFAAAMQVFPAASGDITLTFKGALSSAGADSVALASYAVIIY